MKSPYFLYFVILLFMHVSSITSTPVMDKEMNKYEEYIIEHEISVSQARNVSLSSNSNTILVPAGCQECTKEEKRYCASSDLISDHCCCDRRFREVLPYIPHTCYFGPQLCTPIANDCARYNRVRTCCCDKYLFQKWKEKFGSSHAEITRTKGTTLAFILLFIGIVYVLV